MRTAVFPPHRQMSTAAQRTRGCHEKEARKRRRSHRNARVGVEARGAFSHSPPMPPKSPPENPKTPRAFSLFREPGITSGNVPPPLLVCSLLEPPPTHPVNDNHLHQTTPMTSPSSPSLAATGGDHRVPPRKGPMCAAVWPFRACSTRRGCTPAPSWAHQSNPFLEPSQTRPGAAAS